MPMVYYLVGGFTADRGMCGAGVDRMGVGVLDLVFGLAGGGALLAMRYGVVELGGLCPDFGGEGFCVCCGAWNVSAALARRSRVDFHAYARMVGFHGAVPMMVPREFLSKTYAAPGVKRTLPWVFEIDWTERKLLLMLGDTTAVTLSLWLLFVEIVVSPACVHCTIWPVKVFVLCRTGRAFWSEDRSVMWDGCAPESRMYLQLSSCGVWLVISFSSIPVSLV